MLNKIHLGKWEEVMPTIPDGIVDLVVTSPPYNVDLGNNKHKKDSYAEYEDNMPYQNYLNWMNNLFTECNRVLKRGGRMAINIGDGANGSVPTHVDFTHILLNLEHMRWGRWNILPPLWFYPFQMMTTIVWNKNQIGASTAWGSWKSPSQPSFPTQFEYIIVVAKETTKHDGDKDKITVSGDDFIRNSRALWEFPPETDMMKKYDHPAVFPEELPRRLIDQLTYRDDVVLDPFSGAGTTCAVAKQMGRRYIGIEMSKKYHSRSSERLAMIPDFKLDENGNLIPEWMT